MSLIIIEVMVVAFGVTPALIFTTGLRAANL